MPLPNKDEWIEWDFRIRLAAGHVEGIYSQDKYGFNPSINATTEDIWNAGGVLDYLTSAETMDITSSSGNDTSGGSGARTVELAGVNNDYIPIYETVTMDGGNTVTTTNQFLRVNRMRVQTVGDSSVNEGDISVTATTAGTNQAEIPELTGSTTKSQFTVPTGYYAIATSLTLGTLNNDQVESDLQVREENGPWITMYRLDFVESTFEHIFFSPLIIPPKSDVRQQGVRVAGSGNVRISSYLEFYLVREDLLNTNLPRLGF